MKNKILQEIKTSSWQPKFEFTDDLDKVIDDILKPHEDYFLKLHSKVKEIIETEVEYAEKNENYSITFADVCNWQKELFEHKVMLWSDLMFDLSNNPKLDDEEGFEEEELLFRKTCDLPNMYITLGLRQSNVKVGNWTPPAPMFLEELKSMCFSILMDFDCRRSMSLDYSWQIEGLNASLISDEENFEENLLLALTEWYKKFETIHFFEDLNGRLGGIIINIISKVTTDKWITKIYQNS